jgi:proline iminopeptidase
MKRASILWCIIIIFNSCGTKSDRVQEISLWPMIEPYVSDYLQVSELHSLYYELCGNPQGIPVFVLHGGPGGSCSPYMRRFFDPKRFHVILHDQRGAGKSKPFAEIKENTTQYLVEDIERLRKHLNLGQIILFGGSWGSTLSLAYAETYPQQVAGMVLRGIFTATKAEIDHFYHGGVKNFFPETYDQFITEFPDSEQQYLPGYLLSLLQDPDPTQRVKFARIWAAYEIKLSKLYLSEDNLQETLAGFNPYAFALIENYYMANNCFLEEQQLQNNLYIIKDIPLTMVNGRYDMICPPITAYILHEKLPQSKLIIAESSGHWMGEQAIEKELLKAMLDF